MNPSIHRTRLGKRKRQDGSAAVEFALVLPILFITLVPLILYARYMWHYTVAQKAAQDAARYMSSVSQAEMKSKKLAGYAKNIAIEIARREVAELSPGEEIYDADIQCTTSSGTHTCGSTTAIPTSVNIFINFKIFDTVFGSYLPFDMIVESNVTMRYVGK